MADNQQAVIIPAPPRPPASAEPREYFNQLTRWLTNLAALDSSIHYLRGNGLYLPGLVLSAYNLKPGEVWDNDGILTIVHSGDVGLSGVSSTSAVGSVTVTVP